MYKFYHTLNVTKSVSNDKSFFVYVISVCTYIILRTYTTGYITHEGKGHTNSGTIAGGTELRALFDCKCICYSTNPSSSFGNLFGIQLARE